MMKNQNKISPVAETETEFNQWDKIFELENTDQTLFKKEIIFHQIMTH